MSICRWVDKKCCLRRTDSVLCGALASTEFKDGICHFRKETKYGENMYDKLKTRRAKKGYAT